jgi:hypothetical protein
MKSCVAALVACLVLCTVGLAQSGWTNPFVDDKPAVVETEAPMGPAPTAAEKTAYAELGRKPGLTFRQRRAMGLTFRSVRLELRAMQAAGDLEGKDTSTVSVEVVDRLMTKNPKAFADPSLDWDALLAFVERLVALLLKIFALF